MREIAEMVAGIRLDEVEHRMQTKPEEYPGYTDAIEEERIVSKALLEKYGMDKVESAPKHQKHKKTNVFAPNKV